MALQDSYPVLVAKAVPTDVASTDGFALTVPYTGVGYTVRRVTVYNSRVGSTGATCNGATATLSVRGTAGGAGTSIVADAALTGLTGSTIVLDRTVAATGISPAVTDKILYLRTGTASGVTGSVIDVVVEWAPLP
jgi:hypothetical protein